MRIVTPALALVFTGCLGGGTSTQEPKGQSEPDTSWSSTSTSWPTSTSTVWSTSSTWYTGTTGPGPGPCITDALAGGGVFDLNDYDLCSATPDHVYRCNQAPNAYDVAESQTLFDSYRTFYDAATGQEVGRYHCTDWNAFCDGSSSCEWIGEPIDPCTWVFDYTCDTTPGGATGTGTGAAGTTPGTTLATGAATGVASDSGVSSTKGCATGGTPTGFAWLLLPLIGIRRRRSD